MKRFFATLAFSAFLFVACNQKKETSEWVSYGGNPGGTRYSSLKQINKNNVKNLRVAWSYQTGENPAGPQHASLSECTPIFVDGVLYVATPRNQVIALNPKTGKEIWRYNPEVPNVHYANGPTCRGVSTWRDPQKKPDEPFARMIYVGTNDARLIAIDAKTGKLNLNFGDQGMIDLKKGILVRGTGNYQVTSPPAVIGEIVVVGSSINDNWYQEEAKGVVRAYNARNGKLAWKWDPIPTKRGDPGYETWGEGSAAKTGAANVWAVISVDEQRDLVFLPTASPSVDYYGGDRPGENLYANSIVALRGSTGKFVWGFQVVHHDLWDYDIPAQPTLIDINWKGKKVPALLQATKMGNLFFLNRETGKSLVPVEEKNVPQKAVPGEKPWPTQLFPSFEPLAPQHISFEDLFGIDQEELKWAQETYKNLHYEGMFTPGSEKGTLVFPGNIGGVAWGGIAFDPEKQLVIANTNRLAAIIKLTPRDLVKEKKDQEKADDSQTRVIQGVEKAEMFGTPYVLSRSYFVSPKGIPCNPPPWGALAAIHLNDGKKKWEVPLGIYHGLEKNPKAKNWGSPNYGGPLVTAGGLVFIAAAMDDHIRAFDRDTGKILWEYSLPAGGQATPMTYEVEGKQYIVINAGGHGLLQTTPGDYFIAFSLLNE